MSEVVSLSQNPDDRPKSYYDTEEINREDPDYRINEEEELSVFEREGPMPTTPSEFVEAAVKIPSEGELQLRRS
jgi:hypothetical protein